MSLVDPQQHLAVLGSLFAIAALAFALERTRPGSTLTGAVIAILLAIAAAQLHVIPHSAPAYDAIFSYLVPVLIPLFLFQADLRRILLESTRMSVAFLLASVGTVAGVTVAALLLDLGALVPGLALPVPHREAAVAGLFASTYIGGSVNYAALGELTGLSGEAAFFSAATAADNLFSAAYLALIASLPGWRWLARRYPTFRQDATDVPSRKPVAATAASLTGALALALVLVAASDGLVAFFGLEGWRYVVLSALTLLLATAIPGLERRLAGSFELGVAFSFVFFAAIAAGADLSAMVAVAPGLIAMISVLLLVHAVVLLSLGRVCGLSLPELVTASNAAVLGATTAPALAAARGWDSLVTPAVLVGVAGYAIGTLVGSLIFRWGSALFG